MDKLPVQSAEPLRVPLLLLPHSIGSAWQCSGWSRPFSIPPGLSWQVLPCPLLVRDFLAEQMSLRGITLHTEQSPEAITKSNDGLLSLKTNKETIDGFSHVMFATGRKPNTKNLGLEEVGVEMDKNGAIMVDEYSRTSVDSIWAVGDVTNMINLAPVALMEGGAFAKTVFGNEPSKPDYRHVQRYNHDTVHHVFSLCPCR